VNFFEHYFDEGGLHLKYARSAPAVKDTELHDDHEFVFFLGGRARFISKAIQKDLSVKNALWIPKNSFHRFDVEGSDYTRLILRFREAPAMKALFRSLGNEIRLIEVPSETLSALIEGIVDMAMSDAPKEERLLYLQAAIVHLLFEFKKNTKECIRQSVSVSALVSETLSMVDEGYRGSVSIDKIARRLHVSRSLLSHTFKRELGISVYQYISRKRLSVARELIASGVPITLAATQSGFSDYSCFLRMYKAQYGSVPSASANVPAAFPFV
jgi:AraC-like DNA-binding protein